MNDECYICARPRGDFPMAFRGDECCSVTCEKAMQRAQEGGQKAIAPSECSA